MKKMCGHALVALVTTLSIMAAHAEKADKNQKAYLSSKRATVEGSKESTEYGLEGDVEITQGTMKITAERAVVKEFPDGKVVELMGSATKQVTFRQRREGEADFVEAWADRGEFDERTDIIRMFSKVRFKSGVDSVQSEYMQYNTASEKMELRNQIPGEKPKVTAGDNRVVFEIMPRSQSDKKTEAERPK